MGAWIRQRAMGALCTGGVLAGLALAPVQGWACRCGEVPVWPVNLQPDSAWVQSAIAWRLGSPTSGCRDVVDAVDALVLSWIARSSDVTVRIDRADWEFLAADPTHIYLLAQALYAREVRGEPVEPRRVVREVRRASRSCGKWHSPELRKAFRAARRKFDRGEELQR